MHGLLPHHNHQDTAHCFHAATATAWLFLSDRQMDRQGFQTQ